MFPRGPRFAPEKFPDVPGPGHYDVPLESEPDYKRGAFLERADRFNKEKPSDVPGPTTTLSKPSANGRKPTPLNPPSSISDRYAVLQRRLEDLEKVHAEGKKSHKAETDRLKGELSTRSRIACEQTTQLEKLKKHNDVLETRLQELRKSQATEHSENKELRTKLRAAEQENRELRAKAAEAGDAKKAEARRMEELRERDRRISELQRELDLEHKKRETVEARKDKVETETRALAEQLQIVRGEADEAHNALTSLKQCTVDTQDMLIEELDAVRALLNRAVAEYAHLYASTVPRRAHDQLKIESAGLRLTVTRMERKLADSQAQAVELASLVRQAREEVALVKGRLDEAEQDRTDYARQLHDATAVSYERGDELHQLALEFQVIRTSDATFDRELEAMIHEFNGIVRQRQRLLDEELLLHLCLAENVVREHETRLAECERDLEQAREYEPELVAAKQRLTELSLSLADAEIAEQRASTHAKSVEVLSAETCARLQSELAQKDREVQREKEGRERVAQAAQRSRVAEEMLKTENAQLADELVHAEQYRGAFEGLAEEVQALIARNTLAEEEATQLSRFNAEILGHHNPAQRILYVDRIRKELAECKQQLLQFNRERDAAEEENQELRCELDMYKSVAVPKENKPRTNITRVARMPLSAQSLNAASLAPSVARSVMKSEVGTKMHTVHETEFRPGDMTLDEIM